MTALSSRVWLTMRCTVLRNIGGSNAWGLKDTNFTTHLTDVPCLAWYMTDNIVLEPGDVFSSASYGIALPLGTDVTAFDRVGPVTSRGASFLPGPSYRITSLAHLPDRIELTLQATDASA